MHKSYENMGEDDRIFLEVGRCIHHWSMVELNMAALYSYLYVPISEQPHRRFSIRAPFDAVNSFDVRRTMLDVAVGKSALVDDIVRDKWPSLSGKLAKKYKKRHEIAHFTIRHKDQTKKGQILQPFHTFSASISGRSKTPLTYENLIQRRESFANLTEAVADYIHYIRALQTDTEEALKERASLKKAILESSALNSKDA